MAPRPRRVGSGAGERKNWGLPAGKKADMRFVLLMCDFVRAQVPFGTDGPCLFLVLQYWASQVLVDFSLTFPSTIVTIRLYNTENP